MNDLRAYWGDPTPRLGRLKTYVAEVGFKAALQTETLPRDMRWWRGLWWRLDNRVIRQKAAEG